MDKVKIVSKIVNIIEAELASATRAATDSAQEATSEESRAENKYDTRALETSYLASAQAHHAKSLKESLQAYRNFSPPEERGTQIALGALVTTLGPGGRSEFFIGPAYGGVELQGESGAITVLSAKSPLAAEMIGKSIGDSAREHRILKIE